MINGISEVAAMEIFWISGLALYTARSKHSLIIGYSDLARVTITMAAVILFLTLFL
jgi:hypothetical protein